MRTTMTTTTNWPENCKNAIGRNASAASRHTATTTVKHNVNPISIVARIAVILLVLAKVPGSVPISRSLMLTVQCLSACLV
jgi:hypothetical protein